MSDTAIRVENLSKLYPSSFDFPFGSAQGMAQDAQDRPHW
jgi:hypothetical protein